MEGTVSNGHNSLDYCGMQREVHVLLFSDLFLFLESQCYMQCGVFVRNVCTHAGGRKIVAFQSSCKLPAACCMLRGYCMVHTRMSRKHGAYIRAVVPSSMSGNLFRGYFFPGYKFVLFRGICSRSLFSCHTVPAVTLFFISCAIRGASLS